MEPPLIEQAEPNAVLRGGPLDGVRIHTDDPAPVAYEVGEERCVYRPTSETDAEYPALMLLVFDHAETA
jgi:hypothetical protein